MYELTEKGQTLVFDYLEAHADTLVWDALLAWLPRLCRDPLNAAGLALPDGTLFAFVPGTDIEILYEIVDRPNPVVAILRIA